MGVQSESKLFDCSNSSCVLRLADLLNRGKEQSDQTAMMAMTTNSSINVKPTRVATWRFLRMSDHR